MSVQVLIADDSGASWVVGAWDLLHHFAMRVLEARFHPRRKGQPDVVMVGYLVWRHEGRRQGPVFHPGRTIASSAALSKLRYFVALTQPDPYEGLQSLRSEFWSFVRVPADDRFL